MDSVLITLQYFRIYIISLLIELTWGHQWIEIMQIVMYRKHISLLYVVECTTNDLHYHHHTRRTASM